MKMTGWKVMTMAAAMSLAMAGTAMAGWQPDGARWRWQQADGSYAANSWQWLDGNQDGIAECYYFDADGYMLADTVVEGQYLVNADGAWVVNGVVQTQVAAQNTAGAAAGNEAANAAANAAAGNEAAQGAFAAGVDVSGIDRSIGNGFIRQEWIDAMGRNENELRLLLGEPQEIRQSDSWEKEYLYAREDGYRVTLYFRGGVVRRITGWLESLTTIDPGRKYTIGELSALMNAEYLGEILGMFDVWELQDNPPITFDISFGLGRLDM